MHIRCASDVSSDRKTGTACIGKSVSRFRTQVQALECTRPLLPLRPGQAERRTHEHTRHGITALNLERPQQSPAPRREPGDEITLTLTLTKEGREPHQAVGYMADGTMIVVNNSRSHVGKMCVCESGRDRMCAGYSGRATSRCRKQPMR